MGNASSNLTNQILNYYLFQKRLELFFDGHFNPYTENKKEKIELENFYIISQDLLDKAKEYFNYPIYKACLDNVEFNNIKKEEYINKLKEEINNINKQFQNTEINKTYNNGLNAECTWYSRTKLQKEHFDNIIDEATYECFKDYLTNKLYPNVKGIITNEKLIIFYEKIFQIKFLYSKTTNQNDEKNNSLIQLTADFSQISDGIYDINSTQDAYNAFKNLIKLNINLAFILFDKKNMNYTKQETITFSNDTGKGITTKYNFILINDNLNSPQTNNSQNNNNNNDITKNNDNNKQINNNNNYIKEINELKRQLNEERDKNQKLINENQLLQEKINKLNTEINQLQELKAKFENNLSPKTNEMQKITPQNNNDYYDMSSMKPNDKIITVNFVSIGKDVIDHYSMICKYRDLFVKLEARLYKDFPELNECFDLYYEVNGKRVKRYLSLEQNEIKNNEIINIFFIDDE